jgi:hypothetical protein
VLGFEPAKQSLQRLTSGKPKRFKEELTQEREPAGRLIAQSQPHENVQDEPQQPESNPEQRG